MYEFINGIVVTLLCNLLMAGTAWLWAKRTKTVIIVDKRTWNAFEKTAPNLAKYVKTGGKDGNLGGDGR